MFWRGCVDCRERIVEVGKVNSRGQRRRLLYCFAAEKVLRVRLECRVRLLTFHPLLLLLFLGNAFHADCRSSVNSVAVVEGRVLSCCCYPVEELAHTLASEKGPTASSSMNGTL